VQQRALFGLARAHESQGDIEKAREEYTDIAARWPGGPFEVTAQQRAKDLGRRDTKQFYDWFAKQEPAKKMSGELGMPGVKPPFDANTLQPPAQLMPRSISGGSSETPSDSANPDDGPSQPTDEPSGDDQPGDPQPDASPPADEKPAPGDGSAAEPKP